MRVQQYTNSCRKKNVLILFYKLLLNSFFLDFTLFLYVVQTWLWYCWWKKRFRMCGNVVFGRRHSVQFKYKILFCYCFFGVPLHSKNIMRVINNRDGSAGCQVLFGTGTSRGHGGKQVESMFIKKKLIYKYMWKCTRIY